MLVTVKWETSCQNCESQTETDTKIEFTDKIRKLEKWKIVEWERKIFVLFIFFSSSAGNFATAAALIVTIILYIDVDDDDRVKDIGQQMSQTIISPLSWS